MRAAIGHSYWPAGPDSSIGVEIEVPAAFATRYRYQSDARRRAV